MLPKMYRKNKKSKGSDIAKFKDNAAGGPVKLVTNPESAAGQKSGAHIENPGPASGSKPAIPIKV